MIKIETHAHSFGSSWCAKISNEELIEVYKKHGYDVLVITNHLHERDFYNYDGNTDKDRLDYYFSLIDEIKKQGEKRGLKVLEGAEIDVVTEKGNVEFTVYGLDREVFYKNNPLFKLTQEELFNLVEENGGFMYQTHPFRNGVLMRGNPKFMHGAESFNGHFHHDNNNELAEKFTKENDLIALSGTDYHIGGQIPTAGIITNREIKDEQDLVKLCFSKDYELVKLDELYKMTREEYLRSK